MKKWAFSASTFSPYNIIFTRNNSELLPETENSQKKKVAMYCKTLHNKNKQALEINNGFSDGEIALDSPR